MNYILFVDTTVRRQTFRQQHFVNNLFVDRHFVDKTFCQQTFRQQHFVDNFLSTAFCRQTFRRQDILSTDISSTSHFLENKTFICDVKCYLILFHRHMSAVFGLRASSCYSLLSTHPLIFAFSTKFTSINISRTIYGTCLDF